MPTIDDILNARRQRSVFDRVASGSSSTAPAPPSIFERLSQATSEPLPMEGRLSLLPAMVTPERGREWAVPGVLAGAWNAFTAPGRALQGQELGPEEALNVAGTAMLGGMPVARAAGVGGPGELGLNVFHGSPHKFAPTPENPLGKFDPSKIGTGEGAQAYGVGAAYLAENPNVGMGYKNQLADSYYTDKTGGLVTYGNAWTAAKDAARPFVKAPDHAREVALQIQTWVDSGKNPLDFIKHHEISPELKPAYEAAAKSFADLKKHPGYLYKVDLSDEHIPKMLDWDKKLSELPKDVQDAVKKLWAAKGVMGDPMRLNGEGLYGSLTAHLGGRDAATQALRDLGIPGMRYLDQGSRGPSGTGKWNLKFKDGTSQVYNFKPNDDVLKQMGATAEPIGTRNFVVYDPDIAKIIGRE